MDSIKALIYNRHSRKRGRNRALKKDAQQREYRDFGLIAFPRLNRKQDRNSLFPEFTRKPV